MEPFDEFYEQMRACDLQARKAGVDAPMLITMRDGKGSVYALHVDGNPMDYAIQLVKQQNPDMFVFASEVWMAVGSPDSELVRDLKAGRKQVRNLVEKTEAVAVVGKKRGDKLTRTTTYKIIRDANAKIIDLVFISEGSGLSRFD